MGTVRLALARIGRRRVVQIFISFGLLAAILLSSDSELLVRLVGGLSTGTIVTTLALLVANQIINGVRFHYLMSEFGVGQSFRRSLYVNTMSLVGGLAFVSFIGQGVTRVALMAEGRTATSTVFIVTAVERVASLAMLLILAVTSSLLAFGGLHIAPAPGLLLIVWSAVLALIIAATFLFTLRGKQRREIKPILTLAFGSFGWRLLGITLPMHACMILAYLTIATDIIHSAFNMRLVATSTVVMLAASFPISLGGWGIREFAAGYLFQSSNLPSEAGVAMGLAVGVLSLVAMLVNVLIVLILGGRQDAATALTTGKSQHRMSRVMRALTWLAPLAAAVLVNVQLKLPTEVSWVTVNLADPIVIVAGLTTLLFVGRASGTGTLWRIRHFNLALGSMIATIVLGFIHGWIRFGVTDWALYNRLVGLGIVLCYLLTGALATASAGGLGTKTLARGFAVACATTVFAQWLAAFVLDADAMATIGWYSWQFSGMLGNRNAFALALVLALAVSVPNAGLWVGRGGMVIHTLVLGLIAWGIYLSGSRAGAVALIALLIFLLLIPSCRKPLWRLPAGSIAIGIVFLLVDAICDAILGMNVGTSLGAAAHEFKSLTVVQSDRMASLTAGLHMWFDDPIIGAGLGAFMHEQITQTGTPLVIHNSFLWLLAEFGVVGFVTFLVVPGLIVAQILRMPRWTDDWSNVAALGCIVVLTVISLSHEVAYQRPFWLLVGMLIACPGVLTTTFRRARPAST